MSNPWDRPSRPIHGDENDSVLFEWIGRLMSQWEIIEWQIARIHSIFVGTPDSGESLRDYGKGTIFKERLRLLRYRAGEFFVQRCHQFLEGEFDAVCVIAEGFADRRNEVAHGVVFSTKRLPFFRDPPDPAPDRWTLIPPYSMYRNYDDLGYAKYSYTSIELNMIIAKMGAFYIRIGTFRNDLLRDIS